MSETITYRGMTARVRFDARDAIIVGRLLGIDDVIGFHAETAPQLIEAFHDAVDDYLQDHPTPLKRFSGKVMLRLKPELHQAVALAAQAAGKSLNQWGEDAL